jgi:trans-2,3-dihydro-3-hydroxyanthranilate isomerase
MRYRYVTADVFTNRPYGGNPLAVVLNAEGLSTEQMQKIARQFNYSETSFVLPAKQAEHTAWVRIFTPDREVPFAGHPNVGTAVVLAGELAAVGQAVPDQFVFDEAGGLVRLSLVREGQHVVGAELLAPQPLVRASELSIRAVAQALTLNESDICVSEHFPQVASVGLPFLIVQLNTREALRRARPNAEGYAQLLPVDEAKSIYAYTTDTQIDVLDHPTAIQARMFTGRMTEDPATGSATAAMVALRLSLQSSQALSLRVGQGVDMGRPSLLLADANRRADGIWAGVAGGAVRVMEGTLTAPR